MSRRFNNIVVQQNHALWVKQTLDQFLAAGAYGTPPHITLRTGSRERGGTGKYVVKHNRVDLHTHFAMTRDEVVGLAGHELAHWARRREQNRDYYSRIRAEILILFCASLLLYYTRSWVGGGGLAACAVAVLLVVPPRWSRRAELDADRMAASVVGPTPMLAILAHADWLNRNIPWIHPRVRDRIEAVKSVQG